jgi:hypothetical protein
MGFKEFVEFYNDKLLQNLKNIREIAHGFPTEFLQIRRLTLLACGELIMRFHRPFLYEVTYCRR